MNALHFEERYLKPYAEPVSVAESKVGEVYFGVQYYDDEMQS